MLSKIEPTGPYAFFEIEVATWTCRMDWLNGWFSCRGDRSKRVPIPSVLSVSRLDRLAHFPGK